MGIIRLIGWLFAWLGDEELKARIRILEEELEAESKRLRLSELENDLFASINQRNHDRVFREIRDLGGKPMKTADDVSEIT